MTHNIFDSIAAEARSHVVSLRTGGAGSPLFCFPGGGGSVDKLREMVAVLPEGQPVYAIDMEWLSDVEEEFTIEQLAPFYIGVIREIQRSGPYYFCGYSFGALVAYEMAIRLLDEGDCANLVALLDSPNPALMSSLSETDAVQFRKTYVTDRLKKYRDLLIGGDMKAFADNVFVLIVTHFGRYFMPAVKIGFRMAKKPLPLIFRANDPTTVFLKAWRSYVPGRYAKSLVFFRATERGPEHDLDPSMGWSSCVTGGVQIHTVPGNHVDMMSMPSVLVIAEKLATYLDNGSNRKESAGTA
jgi:thioesterase domain-containing protein